MKHIHEAFFPYVNEGRRQALTELRDWIQRDVVSIVLEEGEEFVVAGIVEEIDRRLASLAEIDK